MGRPFEFSQLIKDKAFFRQWNMCAHCGRSLVNNWDEAHHVVSNQSGKADDAKDAWIKEADNCVVLCDACHTRVHENGNFRTGAVAGPDYFPWSHGRDTAQHHAWARKMKIRINSRW